MRRFEKRDRTGAEIFWQVEQRGVTVDRTWGFVDKGERFTSTTFDDEAKAARRVEDLCRQRQVAGYVEVKPRELDPSQALPLDDEMLDAFGSVLRLDNDQA